MQEDSGEKSCFTLLRQCLSKCDTCQNKEKNKTVQNFLFMLSLLFVFFVIFLLNIKTSLTGDDYVYTFIHNTQTRISSFDDILESQYSHYYSWGGRSIVHTIAQLLLLIDDNLIIRLINSIAFVSFIVCIQYHIKGKRANSGSLILILFTLVWFLQPAFGETILWLTGSVNYLWGTLIILLFLLPYRLCENTATTNVKISIYSLIMLFGGVIAGWTNENTAAAMIVMILVWIFLNLRNKQHVPLWAYSGLIGSVIGYIIMISAPGNFVRAEGTSISPFLISFRLLTYTQSFVNFLGLLNLTTVILLIISRSFPSKQKQKELPIFVISMLGVFVSIYVMIFSPGFPSRAWFGSITFNIIAFGVIFYNLNNSLLFIRRIKLSILAFCLLAFSFSFYDAYKDVSEIDAIWKDRIVTIKKEKEKGATSVTFKQYQAKTKFGLGDAPYAQKYMSQYYGIEFILD